MLYDLIIFIWAPMSIIFFIFISFAELLHRDLGKITKFLLIISMLNHKKTGCKLCPGFLSNIKANLCQYDLHLCLHKLFHCINWSIPVTDYHIDPLDRTYRNKRVAMKLRVIANCHHFLRRLDHTALQGNFIGVGDKEPALTSIISNPKKAISARIFFTISSAENPLSV